MLPKYRFSKHRGWNIKETYFVLHEQVRYIHQQTACISLDTACNMDWAYWYQSSFLCLAYWIHQLLEIDLHHSCDHCNYFLNHHIHHMKIHSKIPFMTSHIKIWFRITWPISNFLQLFTNRTPPIIMKIQHNRFCTSNPKITILSEVTYSRSPINFRL